MFMFYGLDILYAYILYAILAISNVYRVYGDRRAGITDNPTASIHSYSSSASFSSVIRLLILIHILILVIIAVKVAFAFAFASIQKSTPFCVS